MVKKTLVLMMSAGLDGEHLGKTLLVLRPEKDRSQAAYRSIWIAEDLRNQAYWRATRGTSVLIVFYDYKTSTLVPVRRAVLQEATLGDTYLHLALEHRELLQYKKDLPEDAIPRVSPPEHYPADRILPQGGVHAFVFEMPEAWQKIAGEYEGASSANEWRALLQRLTRNPKSPWAECRFLLMEPQGKTASFGGTRQLKVTAPKVPLKFHLRVLAFSGETSKAVPVSVNASSGGRPVWSTMLEIKPGKSAELEVPLPTIGGKADGELYIEAFCPNLESKASRSSYTVTWEGTTKDTLQAKEPLLWEVLQHLEPRDESQRHLCREIARHLKKKGPDHKLVDLMAGWGLTEEAAGLLESAPDLVRQVGNVELKNWLQFAQKSPQLRTILVKETLGRLNRSGDPSLPLLEGYLQLLACLDRDSFWNCFPLGGLWGAGAKSLIDVPLLSQLLENNRLDDLLEMVDTHQPPPEDACPHVASMMYEYSKEGTAYRLEREAMHKRATWVQHDRLLLRAPIPETPDLLHHLPPGNAPYNRVKDWYWKNAGAIGRASLEVRESVLMWLHRTARDFAPEEEGGWIGELALLAYEEADPFLMPWVLARKALIADRNLLGKLEKAVAEQVSSASQQEVAQLKDWLKGKRIALLGGQYTPGWVQVLTEVLETKIVYKPIEHGAEWSKTDIPNGVECALVLRWTGHTVTSCAESVLGKKRVIVMRGAGHKAAVRALLVLHETLGSK